MGVDVQLLTVSYCHHRSKRADLPSLKMARLGVQQPLDSTGIFPVEVEHLTHIASKCR